MNFENFNLEKIRNELIRIEDTLIFGFIERAQFALNPEIYSDSAFPELNTSFLNFVLHEIECAHSKARRYSSPDEHPFTNDLPEPVIKAMKFPKLLAPIKINYNDKIMQVYKSQILNLVCKPGNDYNYGSSAQTDVNVLQALSRRIHFGMFVAEAKFNDLTLHNEYVRLIQLQDSEGLLQLLTNEQVEEKLLVRLKKKATIYGREIDLTGDADGGDVRLEPETICSIYKQFVIPLTKEVEVAYLLRRLDEDFKPEIEYK